MFELDQERQKKTTREAEDRDLQSINDVEEALSLGKAARAGGNLRLAIRSYERAVEIDPKNLYCLNALGAAYRHKDLLLIAEETYEKALRIDANNSVSLVGLAAVKRDQEKPEIAIKLYLKALKLDPRNPYALNGIAGVYVDIDNFEEAEKCFKQAAANPKCRKDAVDGLIKLGDGFKKRGDLQSVERINRWLKSLEAMNNW